MTNTVQTLGREPLTRTGVANAIALLTEARRAFPVAIDPMAVILRDRSWGKEMRRSLRRALVGAGFVRLVGGGAIRAERPPDGMIRDVWIAAARDDVEQAL